MKRTIAATIIALFALTQAGIGYALRAQEPAGTAVAKAMGKDIAAVREMAPRDATANAAGLGLNENDFTSIDNALDKIQADTRITPALVVWILNAPERHPECGYGWREKQIRDGIKNHYLQNTALPERLADWMKANGMEAINLLPLVLEQRENLYYVLQNLDAILEGLKSKEGLLIEYDHLIIRRSTTVGGNIISIEVEIKNKSTIYGILPRTTLGNLINAIPVEALPATADAAGLGLDEKDFALIDAAIDEILKAKATAPSKVLCVLSKQTWEDLDGNTIEYPNGKYGWHWIGGITPRFPQLDDFQDKKLPLKLVGYMRRFNIEAIKIAPSAFNPKARQVLHTMLQHIDAILLALHQDNNLIVRYAGFEAGIHGSRGGGSFASVMISKAENPRQGYRVKNLESLLTRVKATEIAAAGAAGEGIAALQAEMNARFTDGKFGYDALAYDDLKQKHGIDENVFLEAFLERLGAHIKQTLQPLALGEAETDGEKIIRETSMARLADAQQKYYAATRKLAEEKAGNVIITAQIEPVTAKRNIIIVGQNETFAVLRGWLLDIGFSDANIRQWPKSSITDAEIQDLRAKDNDCIVIKLLGDQSGYSIISTAKSLSVDLKPAKDLKERFKGAIATAESL